jgi:hypothetical protein
MTGAVELTCYLKVLWCLCLGHWQYLHPGLNMALVSREGALLSKCMAALRKTKASLRYACSVVGILAEDYEGSWSPTVIGNTKQHIMRTSVYFPQKEYIIKKSTTVIETSHTTFVKSYCKDYLQWCGCHDKISSNRSRISKKDTYFGIVAPPPPEIVHSGHKMQWIRVRTYKQWVTVLWESNRSIIINSKSL